MIKFVFKIITFYINKISSLIFNNIFLGLERYFNI